MKTVMRPSTLKDKRKEMVVLQSLLKESGVLNPEQSDCATSMRLAF